MPEGRFPEAERYSFLAIYHSGFGILSHLALRAASKLLAAKAGHSALSRRGDLHDRRLFGGERRQNATLEG